MLLPGRRMESSTDLKSVVRGWLQASPNIGRVGLSPSTTESTFSPRPERLGLGAVLPRDAETHMYNEQLDRRILRKVAGKGIKDGTEIDYDSASIKEKSKDLSDDNCSRSASVRSSLCRAPPAMDDSVNGSLKTKRKRKKKKKSASSSVSLSPPAHETSGDLESPLPQRREVCLLRGGAQQYSEMAAEPSSTKEQRSESDTTHCGDDAVNKSSCGESQTDSASKVLFRPPPLKKRRCHWSGRRGMSLPWSRKSPRHKQRRHRVLVQEKESTV